MINRYDINPDDMPEPDDKHYDGYTSVVLYTDHAAEMREVLLMVNRMVRKAGKVNVNCMMARYGEPCACVHCEARLLLDKHRNYLDKGE